MFCIFFVLSLGLEELYMNGIYVFKFSFREALTSVQANFQQLKLDVNIAIIVKFAFMEK